MSKFKIYDENDNVIGEYIEDFVENTKEPVLESFDISFGDGILAILCVFAVNFPWLIIVIMAWFMVKLLWRITKFLARIVW